MEILILKRIFSRIIDHLFFFFFSGLSIFVVKVLYFRLYVEEGKRKRVYSTPHAQIIDINKEYHWRAKKLRGVDKSVGRRKKCQTNVEFVAL